MNYRNQLEIINTYIPQSYIKYKGLLIITNENFNSNFLYKICYIDLDQPKNHQIQPKTASALAFHSDECLPAIALH